jgi:hypothetical protein
MIPTKINSKIICFGSDDYATYTGKSSSGRVNALIKSKLLCSDPETNTDRKRGDQNCPTTKHNQPIAKAASVRSPEPWQDPNQPAVNLTPRRRLSHISRCSGFNGLDYFSMLKNELVKNSRCKIFNKAINLLRRER